MLWGLLPSAAGNPAVATEGWGQASLLDDEGCMVIESTARPVNLEDH